MHVDRKNDTPYILAKRNSKHAILKFLVENGAHATNPKQEQVTAYKADSFIHTRQIPSSDSPDLFSTCCDINSGQLLGQASEADFSF